MVTLVTFGRVAFAVSLIAFGIQQFMWGDFVPGRAPAWPQGIPGRLVWAWVSGVVLIATGSTILMAARAEERYGRAARIAAISTGVMIFAWALLRHLPLAAADPTLGGAWTQLGKALTFFGGAIGVGGSLGRTEVRPYAAVIQLGRYCLGLFMILCGIQHFIWVEFVTSLVPAWVPGALFWTYFAGVALIAGGLGLLVPWTAPLAGTLSGLMVFTWFVILHLPRAMAAVPGNARNEWTAVFEALAVSGIAFVVALAPSARGRSVPPAAAIR